MSDPTSKTVRGWLVELIQTVSAGANAELLAEIRYLNQGLFGSTAQTPAQNPPTNLWGATFYAPRPVEGGTQPLAKLIADALYISTTTEFGSPARLMSLARLLQYNFYDDEFVDTRNQLRGITTGLDRIADFLSNTPFSATQPLSENGIMGAIWQALYYGSQPGANGGPLTGRELLAAIAVATRDAADCCEEGQNPSGTYPNPATLACPDYPILAAIGETIINQDGTASNVAWLDQESNAGLIVYNNFGLSMLASQISQQSVCVVLARRSDEVDTINGIGGNFNPLNISDVSPAARPSYNYNGGTQATVGPLYELGADGEPIGYNLTVSAQAGNDYTYPVRFYVYRANLT